MVVGRTFVFVIMLCHFPCGVNSSVLFQMDNFKSLDIGNFM